MKILKPDYVDDPPLQELVISKNADEDFEPATDAYVYNDFTLTADAVADAEALEIKTDDKPTLVTPQQDRRTNLSRKSQEASNSRNEELKKLCELGRSLPNELQAEFNA